MCHEALAIASGLASVADKSKLGDDGVQMPICGPSSFN